MRRRVERAHTAMLKWPQRPGPARENKSPRQSRDGRRRDRNTRLSCTAAALRRTQRVPDGRRHLADAVRRARVLLAGHRTGPPVPPAGSVASLPRARASVTASSPDGRTSGAGTPRPAAGRCPGHGQRSARGLPDVRADAALHSSAGHARHLWSPSSGRPANGSTVRRHRRGRGSINLSRTGCSPLPPNSPT